MISHCVHARETKVIAVLSLSKRNYLDVIRREQADHRIMFTLVPVLVYLAAYKYYVTAAEIQFSQRLPDEVIKRPCQESRFRRLLLRSASVAQIVHEVVVTVQRNWWFLRWSVNHWTEKLGLYKKLRVDRRRTSGKTNAECGRNRGTKKREEILHARESWKCDSLFLWFIFFLTRIEGVLYFEFWLDVW